MDFARTFTNCNSLRLGLSRALPAGPIELALVGLHGAKVPVDQTCASDMCGWIVPGWTTFLTQGLVKITRHPTARHQLLQTVKSQGLNLNK